VIVIIIGGDNQLNKKREAFVHFLFGVYDVIAPV